MGGDFGGEEMSIEIARPWGSALLASHFLLLRQKKVSKEKATPGAAPGKPGSLRYSAGRAACQNSPAAQTRQAETSRPACVAQRLPRGPEERPRSTVAPKKAGFHAHPEKNPKNEIHRFSVDASPGPLRGAEQRRNAGGLRLALSEPQASLASRPAFRVAQGTGAAGIDPGSPFLCLLSFGEAKESETPHKGGTPSLSKRNGPKKRHQDA